MQGRPSGHRGRRRSDSRVVCAVRKLEIRNYFQCGIVVRRRPRVRRWRTTTSIIAAWAFWGGPTSGGVIRRNTFTDIMGTGLGVGGCAGTVVEENVILRWHMNPYKVVAWAGPAIICNGASGWCMRNNVVADCHDAAVWEDCCGNGITSTATPCTTSAATVSTSRRACDGTVLQWNTVFDSGRGIGFRENFGQHRLRELYFPQQAGRGHRHVRPEQPLKADADDVQLADRQRHGMRPSGRTSPKEPAQMFDHNVYKFQDWPDVDLRGTGSPRPRRSTRTSMSK